MDLQVEALQNFAYEVLTGKLQPSLKEIMEDDYLVRLRAGHLFSAWSMA